MDWDLPGPRRFMAEVVADLARGCHAFVVLPRPQSEGLFLTALARRTRNEGLGEVTPVWVEGTKDPVVELGSYLDLRVATVEELLAGPSPSRFLALSGLRDGPASAEWVELATRAAVDSKVSPSSSMQLVFLVAPDFPVPSADVFLAVHAWWGRWSQVDIDLVVEQRLWACPPSSVAERHWLRAICRQVAVCDPDLASLLVERAPRSLGEIRQVLAEKPSALPGGSHLALPELPLRSALMSPPSPFAEHIRNPWAAGAIDWHDTRGLVVKTAFLASSEGERELERRLWEGQLEVLLPLVETARLVVCRWFRRHHGGGWAETLCQRADLEDPELVETEIGGLSTLLGRLRKCGVGIPRYVSQTVFRWRNVRNRLAHARVVDLGLLETAVADLEELSSREENDASAAL